MNHSIFDPYDSLIKLSNFFPSLTLSHPQSSLHFHLFAFFILFSEFIRRTSPSLPLVQNLCYFRRISHEPLSFKVFICYFLSFWMSSRYVLCTHVSVRGYESACLERYGICLTLAVVFPEPMGLGINCIILISLYLQ